ncbi:DoxX family protein [Kistimonas scapharcae]|uniref:DoxX family protein n=1 Tax=Kistimonas scapharcae TaxID=1036133 RepID=A0ABP8V562_9GAMM
MTTQTLLNTAETGNTAKLTAIVDLLGRVGLAVIFLLAGMNKIQYYDANAQFLASGGLPAELLPLVIAFEVIGAILLVVGYQARLAALAFAGFSVATALLYHNNLADQMQFLLFFKNIAMAGGFLVLAAHGAGEFSIDAKRRK